MEEEGDLALSAPQEHPRSSKAQQPLGRGCFMMDGGFAMLCIPELDGAGLTVGSMILKGPFPIIMTL